MIVAKTGNWGYGDLCIGDADAGAYRGVGAAGVAGPAHQLSGRLEDALHVPFCMFVYL